MKIRSSCLLCPLLLLFSVNAVSAQSANNQIVSADKNLKTVIIKSNTVKPKKKKSFVPPGFENLLEPQTTQVDIFYGSAYLMSTLATFTPNDITFLDPAAVAGKIPDLLEIKLIEGILSRQMPVNSNRVCLKSNQTGCGKLDPEQVEVIFDDSRFRVDLFIAPDLLAVRQANNIRYLPPSDGGLSLFNALGATLNGQEGRGSNYNIANSTTIAFKESRLLAISNITKRDDLTIDTLALQREINGNEYQAGIFRANAGSLIFIREADFLGISLASSLDTRKDLDQSSGNELQLFLDSRSRVDIFKDDRLISTHTYETGNQIIDTSKLPGGAYDITLRIRNNSGNVREETRFYVKTNRLPPKDQSLYFFDIGKQVSREIGTTLPKTNGKKIIRAGISRRISADFGGDLGFVSDTENSLIEAGIFKLGRGYDLRLNLAAGDNNDWGASLNGNLRWGRTSFTGNLRKTHSPNSTELIGAAIAQASFNISIPLNRSSINLTTRFNKRNEGTDENYGIRYEFAPYVFGKEVLQSSLQVTKNNGDWQVLLGARISLRRDRWTTDFNSRLYYESFEDLDENDSDQGAITNISTRWQDGDRFLSDVTVSFRAIDEQTDRTIETELDIASNLGRANLEAAYSLENKVTDYGVSFSTSIIANADTFLFGGRSQARAAVIIDIEGDIEGSFFDVEVNRGIKSNAQIGKKTIIPLAPFSSYKITLVPKGNSLVEFSNDAKTATLYPGNVVTLKWKATRILVAFGQIINPAGAPIANALIKGVIGLATTDDLGLFQAEIDSTTREIVVKTRTSECTAVLPDFDAKQMVVTIGELVCQ